MLYVFNIKKEGDPMRIMRKVFIIVLIGAGVLLGSQNSEDKGFYHSEGLALFNKGNYISAIKLLKKRAEQFESQRGLSYYYLGESYYNLGLMTATHSEAVGNFQQALNYFSKTNKQADIKARYPELGDQAAYKKAWSVFRIAEFQSDPRKKLNEAKNAFLDAADKSSDSLKYQSQYMEAECSLRHSKYSKIVMLLSDNEGFNKSVAKIIISNLNTSIRIFKMLSDYPDISDDMRISAKIKMQDAFFEKGILFENLTSAVFNAVRQSATAADPVSAAKNSFEKADYESIEQGLSPSALKKYGSLLTYSKAEKYLSLYLLTGDDKYRLRLNQMIDVMKLAALINEKNFMKGVRDFNTPSDDESFYKLSQKPSSFFARTANALPEAWYWFGWVQFVANTGNSEQQFVSYLRNSAKINFDVRTKFLREDARYRSFLIRFDKNINKRRALRKLIRELQAFQPKNQLIKDESGLLMKLIQVSLGEQIWGNIVPQSSHSVMFRKIFNLVRQMLVRATRVTGKERVPYLDCLDKLFQVTKDRRQVETSFYKGMYLFLKAEIQETSADKLSFYLEASKILNNISGNFKNEGSYIKARSIFAAAKHEKNKRSMAKMYEDAKPIFVNLINKSRSLRSLYYLGEIFRISGNDAAAKECYKVIVEKTKSIPNAVFWYNNAKAGIQSCSAKGDLAQVKGIDINNVKYPERLLVVDGEEISLERFADPGYVRSLYRSDALTLMKKFGMPKLSLYPSDNLLQGSVFKDRAFPGLSSGINERTGSISSGMKLYVILPAGITRTTEVSIDGKAVNPNSNGVYVKSSILLGSRAVIKIRNSECYPYIDKHKFTKPGSEEIVVSLLPYLSFKSSGQETEPGVNVIRLTDRLDDPLFIKTGGIVPDESSLMLKDFKEDINLRDFDFSSVLNKFLVVKGDESNLIEYRNDSKISKEGVLNLIYPVTAKKIISPENIAIDNKGNIYVVDWGSHRIVVFNSKGEYLRAIGGLGENPPGHTGKSVHFVFPTSIAIAQDEDGIMLNGKTRHRNPLLFVGDKYGIHLITATGVYWDTIDIPGTEDGSGYTIAVKGYGINMRIYLANKKTDKMERFNAVLRK